MRNRGISDSAITFSHVEGKTIPGEKKNERQK